MNQDIDAMRQIALAVREANGSICRLEGMSDAVFFQQALNLHEQGLIEAKFQVVQGRVTAAVLSRLTAAGHDFINSV